LHFSSVTYLGLHILVASALKKNRTLYPLTHSAGSLVYELQNSATAGACYKYCNITKNAITIICCW